MADSSIRLRNQILTALATGLATAACGGSVAHDDGTGGGAGSAGSAATGGLAGVGGGGTGGTGAVSFGGTGGVSFGGTGGVGATGGLGGMAGVGGEGGFAGVGPFFVGVDCSNWCGSNWTTCWKAGYVPTQGGAEGGSGGQPPAICPAPQAVYLSYEETPCDSSWGVYFYGEPQFDGELCCYTSGFQCPGGRPFKVDGALRVADVCERSDWTAAIAPLIEDLAENTRQSLAQAWLEDARMEHASVAAFARLTFDLLALAAPAELIEASQRASLDEIRHARECFALASRFAGRSLGPDALDLHGAIRPTTLAELVRTTVEEGCVGETLAAMQAAAQRAHATDDKVRSVLADIEREESDHAALAFQIVQWALRVGGAELHEVVRTSFESAVAAEADIRPPEVADRATWHHFGRLSAAEVRDVRARALRDVVAPCIEALLDPSPADTAEPTPLWA